MQVFDQSNPRKWARAIVSSLAILSCTVASTPAFAEPAEVRISVESDLNFGTFMVFGSGRRAVNINGLVTDQNIVAMEGNLPAPAQFTVTYDRGNENKHVLDIEIELYINPPSNVRVGGVEGSLSALETDLPGAMRVTHGQPIRITMPNCRTRTCSRTFRVGGTLDVSRMYGGAYLVIPIPIDAVLISDNRQR